MCFSRVVLISFNCVGGLICLCSLCLSFCISICLSIYRSIFLSIHLTFYLSLSASCSCLSIYLALFPLCFASAFLESLYLRFTPRPLHVSFSLCIPPLSILLFLFSFTLLLVLSISVSCLLFFQICMTFVSQTPLQLFSQSCCRVLSFLSWLYSLPVYLICVHSPFYLT